MAKAHQERRVAITKREHPSGPLAKELVSLLPRRPSGLLGPFLGQYFGEVELADTRLQIHHVGPDKRCFIHELVYDVEEDDDRDGEVGAEEIFDPRGDCHVSVAHRCETRPELCDEDKNVEDEAAPGSNHAGLGPERKLVEGVALHAPAFAEANVREADRTPSEDG